MEDNKNELQQHRDLAVAANNSCWEILAGTAEHDAPTLNPDEAFDLLGRAYAAAYHWRAFNGPDSINAARAAWLCSRAHAVVGDGTAALRSAARCETLTTVAGQEAADFDHFYSAEANARALACLGRAEDAQQAHGKAVALLQTMADPKDREVAKADLASGPWFGVDLSG